MQNDRCFVKVAYIITRSDVMGGASVHVLDLAERTAREGHDVAIFIGGSGIVCDQAARRGLNCVPLDYLLREISPFNDIRGILELKRRLGRFNPDLVHVHSAKAALLGRIAARILNLPVVYTAHGWPFTEGVSERKSGVFRLIEKAMARWSDKIITVSEYDRQIALRVGGSLGDQGRLVTVHNGVHDLPVRPFGSKNADNPFKFIMVARFEEPKDQFSVINALSELTEYSWAFEFVGDGPLLDQCCSLAESLGIKDRIVFSGAQSNVAERLEASDAFVLISQWEGLPLTILEAMRAGLPVVASKVGGVPEAVLENETGLLIERKDSRGLVDALRTILLNPVRSQEMGVLGRKRFESEFEFERMFDQTMAIYQTVVRRDH